MSKDIKSVIKNLSTPNNFTGKFYQIPKEKSIPILKRFQKIEEQGPLSKFLLSFFFLRPALPKPDKDTRKKENYRAVFLMNIVVTSSTTKNFVFL